MVCGFKMEIHPSTEQEEILFEWCRVSHNMWNFLVAKFEKNNELPIVSSHSIKNYSYLDLMSEFGYKNIPGRVVRWVIQKYVWAVTRCYKKLSFRPKFHKYNSKKQSFCLIDQKWEVHGDWVYFPTVNKVGRTKSNIIKLDYDYLKKFNIKEVCDPRFSFERGKWYLSGHYTKEDVPKDSNKPFIGLDWGIRNFMTSSDGEFINYPKSVLREFQRISKLQSIKDKKKKGSKNYNKIVQKMDKAFERLENIKRDFIHQKTTELCKNNSISVEHLDEIIGSRRFLRRMNRISPRGRFIEQLKWKCDKYGSYFVEVDPAYTSMVCCKCGQLHKMKLSDRTLICDCGNAIDRDINAAINIKNRGKASLSF